MKNKYPIQFKDLGFQDDHINPKEIQLFGENRRATKNANLFMYLIRHRDIKMVSDGKEITEVDII